MAADFETTMRRITGTGFAAIETFPLPANLTIAYAARVFKELGLDVIGMHTPIPDSEQTEVVYRYADAFNCNRVVFSGWPGGEKDMTLDALNRMVDTYNDIANTFESRGLQFGLHNHWWEFDDYEGRTPFYYMLEHLDSRIFFEIDTYWVKVAGKDPARVVADFGTRAPMLHIKDGPGVKGEPPDAQLPAGTGVMDFQEIARSATSHAALMIVEFDEYRGDIFEGISTSYDYLTSNGLAIGKT
jgi:sugar phosphate isomerase/epimerase